MIDKKHQFSNVISQNFETSGINIGRTKDTKFTRELAKGENDFRGIGAQHGIKSPEGGIDRIARSKLAVKALEELARPVFSNMSNVANGHDYIGYGLNTEHLLTTAANVGLEYDTLQNQAKHVAAAHKRNHKK